MRVHHLDCAPMEPRGERLLHGAGGWLSAGRLVGHCLAIETARGVCLVDTGFGLADILSPHRRLGPAFIALTRPRLSAEHTALKQLARLGIAARDVRHVICTHLDVDHAGGLSDFPKADVHVHHDELEAALRPRHLVEHVRYSPQQWAHRPRWVPHLARGERWLGFEAVRAIEGLDGDILLIPLPGHSRGHTAVAVRAGSRWLLHCGDAYFTRSELDLTHPRCPPGLALLQRIDETDRLARLNNQRRLRALARDHASDVQLFCAHDPSELSRFTSN